MLKKTLLILSLYYLTIVLVSCCNCERRPKLTFFISKIKLSNITNADETIKGRVLNLQIIDTFKVKTACNFPKSSLITQSLAMEPCRCYESGLPTIAISSLKIIETYPGGIKKDSTINWVANYSNAHLKMSIPDRVKLFNKTEISFFDVSPSIILYNTKINSTSINYTVELTLENGKKLITSI